MSKTKRRHPPQSRRSRLKELLQTPSVLENAPRSLAEIEAYGGKPYLPTDYAARKDIPICTGVLDYFPLALLEVALVSNSGNAQHNPGEDLHWARGKSMDQMNTTIRHIMERGNLDSDGRPHLAKAAWRILAALQIECEKRYGLPVSRASQEESK